MPSSPPTEPIPLARFDTPPDDDDSTSAVTAAVTAGDEHAATSSSSSSSSSSALSSSATATPAAPAPTPHRTARNALPAPPTRRMSRVQSFARGSGFMNSIGAAALIAAVIFGIGAWVGMKIQITQGGKNMDLAIWTACADHEAIQHTALCKKMLAKDFAQFEKRADPEPASDTLVKRDTDEMDVAPPLISPQKRSPYEKLMSKMSTTDRAFVNPDTTYYSGEGMPPDPALRATFFPVMELLVKPISWVFEFIEYMLLVVIFCIHKLLYWITHAILYCLQAMVYSAFENFVRTLLAAVDVTIRSMLPEWLPDLLVSDLASIVCLTALRTYWYSTSYFHSLKWIVILRLSIWAVLKTLMIVVPFLWDLWQSRGQALEGRRATASADAPTNQSAWFRPKAITSAISTSFSRSDPLPLPQASTVTRSSQLVQKKPQEPARPPLQDDIASQELFYQYFGHPKSRNQPMESVMS